MDCIPIILPLQYGEIDLSALRWSIQLVSEQDTFISKPLSVQAGEDSLTVFWKVDKDCTAVPGRIKLTIVGISEDKTEVIKFDGREIMIKAAAYGNFAPTPDTLSAALAQAQKHEEEAAAAAKQAIQAALQRRKMPKRRKMLWEKGHISEKTGIGICMTPQPIFTWTAVFPPTGRRGKALISALMGTGINGTKQMGSIKRPMFRPRDPRGKPAA